MTTSTLVAVVTIALAACSPTSAPEPANPTSGPVPSSGSAGSQIAEARAMATVVKPLVDSGWFSGSAVIRRDGQIASETHAGLANRETNTQVTPHTRFYVASVTKSFTAAAIMMLRDDRSLSLDDPISRFIPDFPHGAITVKQLLTHRSGLAHPVFFPDFYELAKRSYTTAEAAALFKDRKLAGPPGAQERYSDTNYVLLARIIEVASHETYGDFLTKRMFGPLHLATAGNHTSWATIVRDRATGYQPIGMHAFENPRYFDYSIATGAASVYISAEDLARWVEALGSGKVVSAASTTELVGTADAPGILHGRTIAGHRALALTGWDNVGFGSDAVYVPDAHLAVAVTTNENDSGIATYLSNGLAQSVLDGTAPGEPRPLPAATDPARYVGTYKFGSDFYVPGQEMVLVVSNGELFEHQKDPDRLMGLIPMSDGTFMYRSHWAPVTFRENDGHITALTFNGFTATRVP